LKPGVAIASLGYWRISSAIDRNERMTIMHALTSYSPAARLFNAMLATPQYSGGAYAPELSIDVAESDTAYTMRANVPGASKEDVSISIDGNVVRLEVEFKEDIEIGAVWRERRAGKVSRALKFAHPLDAENASAKQEHGVLVLTLPKKAEAQVKRVTIQ
jgi:HSP20 family protein